jgi:hypothetical protein
MTQPDSDVPPPGKAGASTRHRINLVLWVIVIALLVGSAIWTYMVSRQ